MHYITAQPDVASGKNNKDGIVWLRPKVGT